MSLYIYIYIHTIIQLLSYQINCYKVICLGDAAGEGCEQGRLARGTLLIITTVTISNP